MNRRQSLSSGYSVPSIDTQENRPPKMDSTSTSGKDVPAQRKPTSAPPRSADQVRRSNLNMDKMVKKNVLTASRSGSGKRGQAVIDYFKKQKQQPLPEAISSPMSPPSQPPRPATPLSPPPTRQNPPLRTQPSPEVPSSRLRQAAVRTTLAQPRTPPRPARQKVYSGSGTRLNDLMTSPIRQSPNRTVSRALQSEGPRPPKSPYQSLQSKLNASRTQSNPSKKEEKAASPEAQPKKQAEKIVHKSTVATKSLCFSTGSVATSLDVSPDGERIVVGFTDGSVRLFEMDGSVPSDRHGYLLGYIDEEASQRCGSVNLRVKVSSDGKFAFIGCRSGPRIVMSVSLSNKNESSDEDSELEKHFHSSNKLRGFGDAYASDTDGVYYIVTGLGVGSLHLWQFTAQADSSSPEWEHLCTLPSGGNTALAATFIPPTESSGLALACVCEDRNVRTWKLDGSSSGLDVDNHKDVPHSSDVSSIIGQYGYGIAATGEPYRVNLHSFIFSGKAHREEFQVDKSDRSGSGKSRRSMTMLSSIVASDDGQVLVAVSSENSLYYAQANDEHEMPALRVIGRNASLNQQYRAPMRVYHPSIASCKAPSMIAMITNPQEDEEDADDGYLNVDPTETFASRWLVPSRGNDCWVCGVRNIRHWSSSNEKRLPPKPAPVESKPAPVKRTASKPPPDHPPAKKPKTIVSPPTELDVQQELARYKQRYQKIEAEWRRRLQGELQMRRLWKQREASYTAQLEQAKKDLEEAQTKAEKAEIGLSGHQLRAEQHASVKSKYEALCEQLQEKLVRVDEDRRVLEQTTRSLLQRVDAHVHSIKKTSDVSRDDECIVCQDKNAVTAVVPCGHLCFCEEDAEEYLKQSSAKDPVCPVCQRELISTLRIY